MPSLFKQYLDELGDKQVFITTLDLSTIRLYPISVWEQNENLFENAGVDALNADAVGFMAKHYGADSDIDAQGRVLVPSTLRRELGMENQPVYLGYDRGAIEVYGEATYERKLANYKALIVDAVGALKQKGLK